MRDDATAPVRPAASANGTVKPSDMPITMSRTLSLAGKCFSTWPLGKVASSTRTRSTRLEHPARRVLPSARGDRYEQLPPLRPPQRRARPGSGAIRGIAPNAGARLGEHLQVAGAAARVQEPARFVDPEVVDI